MNPQTIRQKIGLGLSPDSDCILWQWRVEDGEEQCREVWSGAARIIFGMFTFAFQFLIPLSVSGEGGCSVQCTYERVAVGRKYPCSRPL